MKKRTLGGIVVVVMLFVTKASLLLAADVKRTAEEWKKEKEDLFYADPHTLGAYSSIFCGIKLFNLGPTGMMGFPYRNMGLVVDFIEKGSPADGCMQLQDVIIAANGRKLSEGYSSDTDSLRFINFQIVRRVFGWAIGDAESKEKGGKLTLTVIRGGKELEVIVPLKVLGKHRDNWPRWCPKSRAIVEHTYKYLAGKQANDGLFRSGAGTVPSAISGLFLLASGNPEALENARRLAYYFADHPTPGGSSWSLGYVGVFLSEYYLLTGDSVVLFRLRSIAKKIAEGQSPFSGGWAHGSWYSKEGKLTHTYGEVNQCGLTCLMALTLIKECGLPVDEKALKRSVDYFKAYADRGGIAYGRFDCYRSKGDICTAWRYKDIYHLCKGGRR